MCTIFIRVAYKFYGLHPIVLREVLKKYRLSCKKSLLLLLLLYKEHNTSNTIWYTKQHVLT